MTLDSLTCCKDDQNARRRPSNLSIVPPDDQQIVSSPLSSPYNVSRISSASNLMAIFNDMLRSPTLNAGASLKPFSVHNTSPARPRSASAPWTPDLPVELPGSLLQQNRGYDYPYFETPDFRLSRPTSQNIRRGTHPPENQPEDEGDVLDLLHLFPEPLNHSRSVPSMHAEYRDGAMKSSAIGPAAIVSAGTKSKPNRSHRRRGLSEIDFHIDNDLNVMSGSINATSSNASAYGHAFHDRHTDHGEGLRSMLGGFEVESQRRPRERRVSRRDEVSTFCFSALVVHSPSSCYA